MALVADVLLLSVKLIMVPKFLLLYSLEIQRYCILMLAQAIDHIRNAKKCTSFVVYIDKR